MKKYLLLGLFLANQAIADVQFIDKDKPAPFSGYIFSTDAELKNRQSLMELDYYHKTVPLYEDNIKKLQQQSDLWQKQSQDLALTLVKQENHSFYQNLIYFSLGALLTTAIVYGVNKASH